MMSRIAVMLPEKYRGVFAQGGEATAASPAA
jgi:hypothetical protein